MSGSEDEKRNDVAKPEPRKTYADATFRGFLGFLESFGRGRSGHAKLRGAGTIVQ
jgi:hypothetical protein